MDDDLARLREALADIEVEARDLRWADQRPWRTATHVSQVGDLPEIDLHDLNARLAREAVRRAAAVEPVAVRFVTGRGRHSVGPGGVLGGVVRAELKKQCADRPWQFRPAGAARWLLVTDPERAPAEATGDLGWGFKLLMLAFALAAIVAFARECGAI